MKSATLCFLVRNDQVCLAMKKVRFGAGKYNGFGGKVGDKEEFKDESIEEAIVCEGQEELDVTIKVFKKMGEVTFLFPDKPEWDQIVHVFVSKKWIGTPTESEEMRPEWFKVDKIPYEAMWDDDKYWLPKVLGGEFTKAEFAFDKDGKVIKYKVN